MKQNILKYLLVISLVLGAREISATNLGNFNVLTTDDNQTLCSSAGISSSSYIIAWRINDHNEAGGVTRRTVGCMNTHPWTYYGFGDFYKYDWIEVNDLTTACGSLNYETCLAHVSAINNGQLTFTNIAAPSPTPTPTPTATATATPIPATASSAPRTGTINVVKTVINDHGGTKVVSDFPLFVNGQLVVSGQTNIFPAPANRYDITETSNTNYIQTFSGDCDANGGMNLNRGENRFCIITNDDIAMINLPDTGIIVPPIPPLIDILKVPNPLALPGGPGPVTYTYTLHNIGTVPVTDVTMVGDTCSPIVLVSGDTNSDSRLDTSETWAYTCRWNLTATHTNTITAMGWANGISAIDIASATVIVGVPLLPNAGLPNKIVVPPLIHITKVPDPLTLSAGGGLVKYTAKVTNPGKVPLSNIHVVDDKCVPMKYTSGDKNINSKLDLTETWTYTCQTQLIATTTNTVSATGEADGLKARDVAIVTVIVAPSLPTMTPSIASQSFQGILSGLNKSILWIIIALLVGILTILATRYFTQIKQWLLNFIKIGIKKLIK